MPTYEYLCDNCGNKLEKFQMISAAPLRKCPECGKMKLRRLLGTGAGIIFKGSGFYETDYRSESYKKAQEGEKPASSEKAAAKTEKAASASTEKKTETKESKTKNTTKTS